MEEAVGKTPSGTLARWAAALVCRHWAKRTSAKDVQDVRDSETQICQVSNLKVYNVELVVWCGLTWHRLQLLSKAILRV